MIESVQPQARETVLAALHAAAARTGSDFEYLLGTAMRESSLDANAQASTSSAVGLFQFTGQTWLATIKAHGAEYGLGQYADAIHQGANGRYTVDSPETKQQILALRNNPQIASYMAGEAAQDTRQSLEGSLCRRVSCGELYLAHFLGEGGARKLIEANDSNPSASAASIFPQAAQANRHVFYRADGSAKSVSDVYAWAQNMPAANDAGVAAAGGAAPARSGRTTSVGSVFDGMDLASAESAGNDDDAPPAPSSHAVPGFVPQRPTASVGTVASLLPQAPLNLMPGVLEILAGLDPSPMSNRREN